LPTLEAVCLEHIRNAGMGNRRIECARSKVLGNCTSINVMAYARGMREDFDHWAQGLGLAGWSYQNVLPYFKRAEVWEEGESAMRSGDGPLTVTRLRYEDSLLDAFMAAADLAGYARNVDYNGEHAEGFGPMQNTIRRGRRWSVASAYLRPAVARGNVTVRTGALAVESQEVVHGRDAAHGRLVVESGVWPAPAVALNEGLRGSLALS